MEVELLQALSQLRALHAHVQRGETEAALALITRLTNRTELLIDTLEED